jgi:membrane fusion protein, multidrug efflux system
MSVWLRGLLPGLVLSACGAGGWWLWHSKPLPKTKSNAAKVFPVKALTVNPERFPVVIPSRGVVRPRTESALLPEVGGLITLISPHFREGGFFEKGEVLVTIDPRDYETSVALAEGELAKVRTTLEEERARGAQATEDWHRLGRPGEPPPLAARVPQRAEAEALVAAAEATVAKARRSLGKTQLIAPYAGCVLKQMADVGQVAAPGSKLADIYATDVAEVELPLTQRDLSFLDLPELYRPQSEPRAGATADPVWPRVTLKMSQGGHTFRWEGRIVRAAGAIDSRSRQLSVVAHIDDPYAQRAPHQPPLRAGLYVEAEIEGRVLESVFALPRSVLREGKDVLLIEAGNKLKRRPLEVVWGTEDQIIATNGLKAGDVICVTQPPLAVDGTLVKPVALAGEKKGPAVP